MLCIFWFSSAGCLSLFHAMILQAFSPWSKWHFSNFNSGQSAGWVLMNQHLLKRCLKWCQSGLNTCCAKEISSLTCWHCQWEFNVVSRKGPRSTYPFAIFTISLGVPWVSCLLFSLSKLNNLWIPYKYIILIFKYAGDCNIWLLNPGGTEI